jgi:HAMP domain-containing protein
MATVPDPASPTTPGDERGAIAGGAAGGPRFGSLRARLIASHALVLVLALALVFAASAGLLRREERRAQTERLADLAVPLLVEVRFLDRREIGAGRRLMADVLDRQAEELDVRLLVFAPDGTVRYDSGPAGGGAGMVGQRPSELVDDVRAVDRRARGRGDGRPQAAAPRRTGAEPFAGGEVVLAADGRSPGLVLGIVAPRQRRPLVGRYLPPLGLTLAGALAVAALAGYLLSRRLAAPVTRLTAAADAMAAGDLEQRVAGEGPDELGRLVASFNAMSRRVAATARSQRDLLANVAHELRTPLTSIRGYAQGLRDGVIAAPADRERALATMSGEAERMGTLIAGLLELARLESVSRERWTHFRAFVPTRENPAGIFDRAAIDAGIERSLAAERQ